MPEITLNILASDIEETSYYNTKECAITRALQRAGKIGWMDNGTEIQSETGEHIVRLDENDTYSVLVHKVINMYHNGLRQEDFTHTIVY